MAVYLVAGRGDLYEGKVNETANTSGNEGLDSVLAAIRKMVRKETRSRMDGAPAPEVAEKPEKRSLLVLQPHMRVKKPPKTETPEPEAEPEKVSETPEILERTEEIPHAPPVEPGESFAIANPAIDEEMLRDMVREVVREELRGEIGRDIVRAMKLDLIRALEKY